MSKTTIIDDYINAPHAFPGGYPKIMIMKDGGFVCPKCVKENRTLIIEATADDGPYDQQWAVATVDLHLEGPAITCDHCGEATESAYGEGDDEATPD